MLGKLFGSNARVKILKIFLTHPDEKYYIRQLARDLELQVNSVRRELENLEKFGLLISKTGLSEDLNSNVEAADINEVKDLMSGKIVKKKDKEKITEKSNSKGQEKKYYQTNKDFILYEEVKALVTKAQVLYEKDFIDNLKDIGSPKLIILTGVFANPSSPIDILIVGKINKVKFGQIVKDLEKELDKELNFTLMDAQEFKYRRDITDVFLYSILENDKIVVIDEIGIS